ncbi:MAG: homoserine kinase [Tepidibacillus sp.]
MNAQMFEVKVPGSTANLGPGFDSLGLALPLYLTIRLKPAAKTSIKIIGDHLSSLPRDRSNLIYQVMEHLFHLEEQKLPPISLEVESEIPLSRGLGSSGSAIVGGLLAANELLERKKSKEELFQIASQLEGHSDNVGASLFGGFVATSFDGKRAMITHFPFAENLRLMLAIPTYTLSTESARKEIPNHIPVKDAAYNIGQTALLISFLMTGQIEKLATAMNDRIHQPYRQNVVKGLKRILEDMEQMGIYGAALSGAGPTILLFVNEQQISTMENYLKNVAMDEQIDFQIKTLSIEKEGAIVYHSTANRQII